MSRVIVPDLLAPGLRLVFCGTAPSVRSKEAKAYYAHPGNRFWKTLHEVGLTPRRFVPSEYPELLRLGIGLTDVCKTHFGNDVDLRPGDFDPDALHEKLERFRPTILAFTSKKAASVALRTTTDRLAYGFRAEPLVASRVCVLPSTSGQAVYSWDIAPWRILSEACRALS